MEYYQNERSKAVAAWIVFICIVIGILGATLDALGVDLLAILGF